MRDIKMILSEKQLDAHSAQWHDELESVTEEEVCRVLGEPVGSYSPRRLMTLVSPAAENYLEEMAQSAQKLTCQRFGRTIQLYAPLYVSNYCINNCSYCGYNTAGSSQRIRLSIEQALAEADVIAAEGFRHILLVSGEDPEYVSVRYLGELAKGLKEKFSSISLEIYPMNEAGYAKMFAAGIDGVTLYQETYDRKTYCKYHVAGPKSDYDDRLAVHDHTASAGMRRLGLGVLLGLADWRIEALALAEHASYLMKHYWRSQISFSFPRLRPAENVVHDYKHLISDSDLVQMMLALRLCFADAGIVLSTRESAKLRDNLVKLCVTRMSAGSKTNPGGYTGIADATEQFTIDDDRSPQKIAAMIRSAGLEAVWKDWDTAFTASPGK